MLSLEDETGIASVVIAPKARGCTKQYLTVTRADNYSYFNAAIGSTREARRAGR